MDRERIGKLLGAVGRYRYAALALALGIVLLCLPRAPRQETQPSGGDAEFDLAAEKREIEAALSRVRGAGRLSLVLTLASGEESELADDAVLSYRGRSDAPDSYEKRSETVILGSGSGAQAVVRRRLHPRYRGALVVCEGGADADVRFALTEALSALTGLGSDRICVLPLSGTEGGTR